MKKYLLSTLAIGSILACATIASAEPTHSGYYAVGEAGWAAGVSDNDDAGAFALGMGYRANEYMRMDMTVGLRPWGAVHFKGSGDSKSDIWSVPVLANVYATYPIYHNIGIYGMGGLGLSWTHTDSITNAKGKTRTNFAWTAGAGVEYRMNDCWSFDLGYRFTDLGDARISGNELYDGKSKRPVRSNDLKLSARYYF